MPKRETLGPDYDQWRADVATRQARESRESVADFDSRGSRYVGLATIDAETITVGNGRRTDSLGGWQAATSLGWISARILRVRDGA